MYEEPCALCGKPDELRPYGPNHEPVCPACAAARFRALTTPGAILDEPIVSKE